MVRVKTAVQSEFKGIFFDYGGVIEDLMINEDTVRKGISAIQGILERRGVVIKTGALAKMVKSGHEAYEKWYGKNGYRELPNGEIWSAFLLKEICAGAGGADTPASGCDGESTKSLISAIGEELGSVYEYYLFKRRVARDLKSVLMTLFYSGFVLSVVSNTMSSTLIPERLKKFGIDSFFRAVVLSVDLGVRKPDPGIFYAALARTGLGADRCMYVGDTLSRDIEGSKAAGFRSSVLMTSGITKMKDRDFRSGTEPDHRISTLSELFPLL
jgi:putative hydrolase of the HAD superfamily